MRRIILTLLAFFFSLTGAQADAFDSGNEAYASGRYQDAIREFESVAARKEYSSALFYNLGNAFFRSGRTGEAVLNYERALWLNPSDPDARANLRFVRKTAGLFEPAREWWQVLPGWLSLNAWSWMACGSWFVLSALLILRRWKRDLTVLKPVIAVASIMLAVSLASALIRVPDTRQAVVLAVEAPLRVAPLEKSAATATLRAGDEVRIANAREGFLYVETEDGKAGWATDKEVQPIISHF